MKLLLPILALLLVGCGGPQGYVPTPTAKPQPAATGLPASGDLMPLAVGNVWRYTMKSETFHNQKSTGSTDSNAFYRVESMENGDATLILEMDGKMIDRQGLRTTANGLYQTATGLKLVPTVPPQPLVQLPIKTGQRFRWKGKAAMPDGKVSQGTADGEVLPEQTIDTGMGRISATPIKIHMKYPTGESENIYWYRPGVGLVRYRQTTVVQSNSIVLVLAIANLPTLKRP